MKQVIMGSLVIFCSLLWAEPPAGSDYMDSLNSYDQYHPIITKEHALVVCNQEANAMIDPNQKSQMRQMCSCINNTTDFEHLNSLYYSGDSQALQGYMQDIGEVCLN